jgi:molybdopterin-guanine dinucleotide biosynthesis protein A
MSARPLPVVLTGGRSRRYGRDKLREPCGGALLVDAPLRALREVFGAPVAAAGACHPEVAARFDLVIPDGDAGRGPIEGIVSALRHELGREGVFVLAGDLPRVEGADVRKIWDAAVENPLALAVLADSGRQQPCIGLYRPNALPKLVGWLSRGGRSLHDALPSEQVMRVPIAADQLTNINAPTDWGGNEPDT